MSIVDDGRELQVRDVCQECQGGLSDLMVVQCNASNFHGYAFSSAYINVLGEYYFKQKTRGPWTLALCWRTAVPMTSGKFLQSDLKNFYPHYIFANILIH